MKRLVLQITTGITELEKYPQNWIPYCSCFGQTLLVKVSPSFSFLYYLSWWKRTWREKK